MRGPERSLRVGGGVWRIRWHPRRADLLLLASMYAGAHLVHATRDSLRVHMHVPLHESITYGAAWSPAPNAGYLAATCSFYDRRLALWRPSQLPPWSDSV
jgi:diphthamide biosynthesis protein 7